MSKRITFLGLPAGMYVPPMVPDQPLSVNQMRHPVSGDVLTFEVQRPITIDTDKMEAGADKEFMTDVVAFAEANTTIFRVEDVSVALPIPAVFKEDIGPGTAVAPPLPEPPPVEPPPGASA